MRRHLFLAAAVLILMSFAPAAAQNTAVQSRTYLSSWSSGDTDHLTLYEYLDAAMTFAAAGLTLQVGGWGRGDLLDESWGESTNGELQHAGLSWASPNGVGSARAGRFAVTGGVSSGEWVDGLSAAVALAGGVSLSAYGGVPVETDDDGRGGDAVYGVRAAVDGSRAGLGLSYLKEENDGNDAREEAGVDLRLAPWSGMELAGRSEYDLITDEWMSHDYGLRTRVAGDLRAGVTVSWWDYDAAFAGSGVFSPPFFPAGETLLDVGLRLDWEPAAGLCGGVEYHRLDYRIEPAAYVAGARLLWRGSGWSLGASYRRVHGGSEELRYAEYRGWAEASFGPVEVFLDAAATGYDREVNGVSTATATMLGARYPLADGLRLSGTVEYGSDADMEYDARALVALVWEFGGGGR